MRGKHPPDTHCNVERGMLDDDYWVKFTSDANDYELGSAIGFGASSTVYSAIFTLPQQPDSSPEESINTHGPLISTSTLPQSSSSARRGRPKLSITLPQPSNHNSHPNPTKGTEGDVTESSCAVKVSTSHPDVDQLFEEIRLLALCRHPNVLRILSTFTLPPDHHRIALVTPLISGGSLAGILDWRTRLTSTPKHRHFPLPHFRRHRDREDEEDEQSESFGKGKLEEEEIKAVIKQVLEGLNYLHQTGFLHRDLKAGNLLIDQDGTILLADFGVGADLNVPRSPVHSRHTRPTADTLRFDGESAKTGFGPGKRGISGSSSRMDIGKRKSFVGTPNWMAPEIVLGQKYDSKADIWSLGITILELAYGSAPGSKSKLNDILARIVTGAAPSLDRSNGGFSKHMKEFADACLVKDPEHRPSAAQLAEHAWLKGAKKKAYLAQSLIGDVPPLYQRQELRRVPTMSSLISRASSWDFSATPAPSMPSSPIRTSNSLLLSARTPHSHGGAEYFSSVAQSRSHSRNSSFSHTASVLPPSPRVSLRQWAERSATSTSEYDTPFLGTRTGSEQGKMRSSSSMSMRIGTSTSRLGKSASFDIQRGRSNPTLGVGVELGVPRRSGLSISPSTTKRELRTSTVPSMNNYLTEDGVSLSTATKEPTPMTPLLEISPSQGRDQDQWKLDAVVKLDSSQPEQTWLFSSPEVIASSLPHEEVTPTSHSKRHSDSKLEQNNESRMSINGDDKRSSTSVDDVATPRQISNGAIDTNAIPVQADGLAPESSPNDRNIHSLQPQSVNGLKTNQSSIPTEKKNWLGRKVSLNNSGKDKKSQIRVPFGMGTSSSRAGQEDAGGTMMGKTASWTNVFGKVAGKIQKDKR